MHRYDLAYIYAKIQSAVQGRYTDDVKIIHANQENKTKIEKCNDYDKKY